MIDLQNRKILIYADDAFGLKARKKYPFRAKTADGVLRFAEYEIVGVVDSTSDEKNVAEILNIREDVPIFKNIQDIVRQDNPSSPPRFDHTLRQAQGKPQHKYQGGDSSASPAPDVLLLGVAPEGGKFPEDWREDVIWAMQNGMDIVAGMHFELAKDEEFSNVAKLFNREIQDVRVPPKDLPVGSAKAYEINPGRDITRPIILTVSTDPAVGKLTTTMAIVKELQNHGKTPCFIPTGQTSIMIAGWGIAVDACAGDFQAGAVEQMLLGKAKDEQWTHFVVKGQGSIYHPGYSNTTIALIHGAVPTHMVMVHRPQRKKSIGSKYIKLPPLNEAIKMYEGLVLPQFRNCKVVGISLNTFGMKDDEAREEIEKTEFLTGLPTVDVIRFPEEIDILVNALT